VLLEEPHPPAPSPLSEHARQEVAGPIMERGSHKTTTVAKTEDSQNAIRPNFSELLTLVNYMSDNM
jgi:hypothetical protein